MKTDRAKKKAAPDEGTPDQGERVAKRLARAGLCSRRDAERWIAEGRVAVNGTVLESPAVVVRPGDVVAVDGNPIPEAEPSRVWRYHKPAGLVTTARDEKGRDTVFDKLPEDLPRVVSIGRLDLTTEGLLLLTNDGELARHLELPATGWTRRYRVRVHGAVDEVRLAALSKGLEIEGVRYGPIEAALDKVQGSNAWLSVGLKEGKNREIRKVMESLGLQVTRLIRLSYGPFQLGKLPVGEVEEVPRRVLTDQIRDFFPDSEEEESPPAKQVAKSGAKPAAKTRVGTKPPVRRGAPSDSRGIGKPGAKPGGKPGVKPSGRSEGRVEGRSDGRAEGRSGRKTLSLKRSEAERFDVESAGTKPAGTKPAGAKPGGEKPRGGKSAGPRTGGTGHKSPGTRADSRNADSRGGGTPHRGEGKTDASRTDGRRDAVKRNAPGKPGGNRRDVVAKDGPGKDGPAKGRPAKGGAGKRDAGSGAPKRGTPRGKDDANRRR